MALIQIEVPQGSILGSLLYPIYQMTYAIPVKVTYRPLQMIRQCIHHIPTLDELYANANEQTNDLYHWFCSNRLSLNAKKKQVHCIETKTYER